MKNLTFETGAERRRERETEESEIYIEVTGGPLYLPPVRQFYAGLAYELRS